METVFSYGAPISCHAFASLLQVWRPARPDALRPKSLATPHRPEDCPDHLQKPWPFRSKGAIPRAVSDESRCSLDGAARQS